MHNAVQKIEETLPKACDGPPPDLTKLIPSLQVDGEGGGLKPMNHFNADHVRDLPSLSLEGYDAPLPVVLLVLTSALRTQLCMERSNVFPGTYFELGAQFLAYFDSDEKRELLAAVDLSQVCGTFYFSHECTESQHPFVHTNYRITEAF